MLAKQPKGVYCSRPRVFPILPMTQPTPSELIALRKQQGLSQAEFGQLVYVKRRIVQYWEEGARDMPPALWELLNIRLGRMAPRSVDEMLAVVPESPQPKRPTP